MHANRSIYTRAAKGYTMMISRELEFISFAQFGEIVLRSWKCSAFPSAKETRRSERRGSRVRDGWSGGCASKSELVDTAAFSHPSLVHCCLLFFFLFSFLLLLFSSDVFITRNRESPYSRRKKMSRESPEVICPIKESSSGMTFEGLLFCFFSRTSTTHIRYDFVSN